MDQPPAAPPAATVDAPPVQTAPVLGPPPRPASVTVAAVFLIVLGVLIALIGLLLTGIGVAWPAIRNQPELATEAGRLPDSFGIFMLVVGLILLAWALADVVAGIFVMQRRQWARIAGIVTGAVGGLVGIPFMLPTDAGVNVAGLVVALPLAGGHLYAMWVLIRAGRWFSPERQLSG
jgi:hypothetical protein